jgi:outer membrane protein OmpA-like peptidoglycan-associated protein
MDQDDYIIDLHGFTDTKASHEYNKALSQRRSLAVRAYLIAAGVQASKLDMDGFGEINSRGADIVEMALERKVELNLNELNSQVTFVDQVEDIQVNQRAAKIGGWSYVFRSEHNAVPLNLNLRRGSAELNRINTYLIKRIAIALANYPEVNVRIALPNDNRFMSLQNAIMNELTANNADITRFMFDRGVAERSNEVRFNYYNTDHLVMIEQDDDIKFAGRSDVHELMESMLRVLKSREDYELIHDLSQSYVVPDRVMFEKGSTTLDNENQAIMSRIGSYLRNNEQVYLELIGEGTSRDNHRVESMREYLLSWGIDGDRLRISDMTTETNGTCIRIEYKNADSINIKNVESINGGGRR